MAWAAAIAAGANIGSAILSSNAADKAASATGAAAAQATAEQKRQYDISRADQQPWLTTGGSALNKLAGLYGLDTYTPAAPGSQAAQASDAATLAKVKSGLQTWGGAANVVGMIDNGASLSDVQRALTQLRGTTTNPRNTAQLDPIIQLANTAVDVPQGTYQQGGTVTQGNATASAADPYADFYQSPDYQFRFGQGIKGVDAGAAARGMLDSGATRKAEISYAGNLASGEYNNYAARLSALAGVGQIAAQGNAQTGSGYASNIANIAQRQGDNLASSYLTQGGAYSDAIRDLGGIGSGLIKNLNKPASSDSTYYDASTGEWHTSSRGF